MKKIIFAIMSLSIFSAITAESSEPSYSKKIERMNLCSARIKEFEMNSEHNAWMQGYIAGIHYSLFGDCVDMCIYK